MAEAHEKWILELFSGLKEADKQQLHSLLALLKMHVASVQR
jgi:hypothetical protein